MPRGRPAKCPYCHQSGKSVRKGVRRTKTLGLRRILLCKTCKRKFTPKHQKPMEKRLPSEEKSEA